MTEQFGTSTQENQGGPLLTDNLDNRFKYDYAPSIDDDDESIRDMQGKRYEIDFPSIATLLFLICFKRQRQSFKFRK